jgi:hypothetical protein
MTAGVSIGWFTPNEMVDDLPGLVADLQKVAREAPPAPWPLHVLSIDRDDRPTGVAYAVMTGHIPIHIDQALPHDGDGRIFHFVLSAENRPALLTAPADRDDASKVILGANIEGTFGMGGFELKSGMAVHFDITKHWHGVTQLPIFPPIATQPPEAVFVQVAGFRSHQINPAFQKARLVISQDLAS